VYHRYNVLAVGEEELNEGRPLIPQGVYSMYRGVARGGGGELLDDFTTNFASSAKEIVYNLVLFSELMLVRLGPEWGGRGEGGLSPLRYRI
jgi:hypothetical protein